MRVTRAIAAAGLCCIMLGGCAGGEYYEPGNYVVQPQDTLYSIAWRHGLDYRELAKWNGLGADYRLRVGQVLVLSPRAAVHGAASPPAASAQSAAPGPRNAARTGRPLPLPEPPLATAGPPADGGAPRADSAAATSMDRPGPVAPSGDDLGGRQAWVWPTDRLTAPRPVPGGGILLLGRLGQDVRAARAGRVVYTGSGIRGYGNLIIIKHGESVLTSYAHNHDVLVREGQEVAAGQTIAHMGTGSHQVCALYFEIRVNGKPVDPLRYLAGAK